MHTTLPARNLATVVPLSLLLFSIVTLLYGCGSKPVASRWTSDPIHVDGQSRDWDKLPRMIFENPRVSCGVSNDAHQLYLLIHANDRELVRRLTQQGVTLWFDAGGKKHKSFGLACSGNRMPGKWMEQFSPRGKGRGLRDDSLARNFQPPALEKLAVLDGSARNRIPISAKDARMPAAESLMEGAGFTYEFSIPLTLADGEFAIGAEPGATISVGIELGEEPRGMGPGKGGPPEGEGGEGGGPGGRGGPGGGMGGRGGGGRPGGGMGGVGPGGMGGPQGEQQSSSGRREIWFKVMLAQDTLAMK